MPHSKDRGTNKDTRKQPKRSLKEKRKAKKTKKGKGGGPQPLT